MTEKGECPEHKGHKMLYCSECWHTLEKQIADLKENSVPKSIITDVIKWNINKVMSSPYDKYYENKVKLLERVERMMFDRAEHLSTKKGGVSSGKGREVWEIQKELLLEAVNKIDSNRSLIWFVAKLHRKFNKAMAEQWNVY